MQCTFCGTENRPEYKFCGMCGVKLERRQSERRVRQDGMSAKCATCGHSGEPGLKFCGMCGARVERRVQDRRAGDPVRAAAIANAQLPTPEASRAARMERPSPVATAVDLPPPGTRRGEPAIFRRESASQEPARPEAQRPELQRREAARLENTRHEYTEQPISGPSFLGLNAQPEESTGEYLLEEESSSGGLRKVLLVVVILAILGLVFVQWRSSFKASPAAPPSKAEPASTPAGNNLAPAGADPSGKDPASSSKDPSVKDPSAVSADMKNDSPSGVNAAGRDPANVAGNDPASNNPAGNNLKTGAETSLGSVVPNAAAKPAPPRMEPAGAEKAETGNPPADRDDAKAAAENHVSDTKPSAALLRAQQFLHGQGVPQNCEQGMLYLKAATDKGDPGAAVQMAALYSSGHCVKQDRVMAYRWFNSAHELEPANMWIQKNMDQLWAAMTPQERRLAGY